MKGSWMLAAMAVAVAQGAQPKSCNPDTGVLTVFTFNANSTVPLPVLVRAQDMASQVLAGANVSVIWAKKRARANERPAECGESLMIVFDVSAPAGFSRRTIACATVSARTPIAIHVFYDRVAAYLDSLRMPGFLGHVIAHEIVHVLQGEARHSREGLMKANWDLGDCAEMGRAPLPFAQEDLELINEHVKSVHVNTARK